MNKILIPSILTATILIAAAFAVIDVDRAMAGHLPSVGVVTSASIGTDVIIGADIADQITLDQITTESAGDFTINVLGANTVILDANSDGDAANEVVIADADVTIANVDTVNLTVATDASIDAVRDVFIDSSGTGAVSISAGTEAADSVPGAISIDAVLDVFIDTTATGAVSISAGTEAADSVAGEISIDALDNIHIDTTGAGGIEISAGAETQADPVNDVLALNSVAATTILAGTASKWAVTAGPLELATVDDTALNIDANDNGAFELAITDLLVAFANIEDFTITNVDTVNLTVATDASIDAVRDVFIDSSGTGAVSISAGTEAADSVPGAISIDAVLDVFIDTTATGAVSISAGTEAADSVAGEISIDALDNIHIDTTGAGGIEISAGAETQADPVNDVLALNSVAATTILAGTASKWAVTAGPLELATVDDTALNIDANDNGAFELAITDLLVAFANIEDFTITNVNSGGNDLITITNAGTQVGDDIRVDSAVGGFIIGSAGTGLRDVQVATGTTTAGDVRITFDTTFDALPELVLCNGSVTTEFCTTHNLTLTGVNITVSDLTGNPGGAQIVRVLAIDITT